MALSSCTPETTTRNLSTDKGNQTVGTSNANGNSSQSGSGSSTQSLYLQEGSVQTTTALTLNSDFNDSFYLRGPSVHSYLQVISSSSKLCMISYFPSSLSKKILVLSAVKSSFYNFSTGESEYYFKVFPDDKERNQNDCLTISLSNALNARYSTLAIAYKLSELCPNCSSIAAQPLEIYNNSGASITQIQTGLVRLNVTNSLNSNNNGSFGSCSTDSTCLSQNYDCCLQGQCVNDGAVKSSVNISSNDFLTAQNEVISSPASYKNYPEFYYICPSRSPANDQEEDVIDEEAQAQKRFENMKNLHECLNPISDSDETSYCSVEFSNVSSQVSAGGALGADFSVGVDDINFSSINSDVNTACGPCTLGSKNNIVEVNFGGSTLYKECEVDFNSSDGELNAGLINDDQTTAQSVNIKKTTTNSDEDYLKIKYRVDGTCKKLNGSFSQCKKYYVQGQSSCPTLPSDHGSSNMNFKMPSYANLNFNVIVKVGDTIIPESASTWQRDIGGQQISFTQSVYPNQVVEITYFVQDNVATAGVNEAQAVIASKSLAQSEVNTMCGCASDSDCNLEEVTEEQNGVDVVIDYKCSYPNDATPEQPLQKTIYVPSKSIPMRFFDISGVAYDQIDSQTAIQEGNPFYYKEGNKLKPNNVSASLAPTYIGPNEVYGNMNLLTDENASPSVSESTYVPDNAPRPPVKLDVKKGRVYNIYVDQGGFSSCLNCGVDYYSGIKRLFPETFSEKGGGLIPDPVVTNPTDNLSTMRQDDILFGRACFVPLTMLPWSHASYSTTQQQRLARLKAQHIYQANGYNRDWFGFDYGSLIASYDGVRWFSIGNRRKTTAKSNKLYFATNSMMGDLTVNNSFKVVISEVTDFSSNEEDIEDDLNSSGAQCQNYHLCETDSDCITQLGHDYVCSNVTNLKTSWPLFDNSGNEVPGQSSTLSLTSLLDGGSNGYTKRCLYRGKGAPCQDNIYAPLSDSSLSYAKTTHVSAHMCAPNYHCEEVTSSNKFNTTIARFAGAPVNQNALHCQTDDSDNNDCTDLVGHSARLAGRPYNYLGNQDIPADTVAHFQNAQLNISGLCLPGKDASQAAVDFETLNATTSTEADKILSIGPSPASTTQADFLYSACPTLDEDKNYFIKDISYDNNLIAPSNENIRKYSASQNILTQSLKHSEFSSLDLFKDSSAMFSEVGVRENTCMKAAGASCFSDYECAPNSFIANEVTQISTATSLSEAELSFWQEPLICSGPEQKRLPYSIQANPDYDLKQNRCCREVGKEMTIYTADYTAPSFDAKNIAGIGIDLNSNLRYSRLNTAADILGTKDSGVLPVQDYLIKPNTDSALSSANLSLEGQYKTFDTIASRTCCTQNWVRNFHSDNGGGHHWTQSKMQGFNKSGLRCLSWQANDTSIDYSGNGTTPYTCDSSFWNTAECEVRNISGSDENRYLNWLAKLELLGIPQIMIETASHSNGVQCLVDGDGSDDQDAAAASTPVPNTIKSAATAEYSDAGGNYLSASDSENFNLTSESGLKMMFDEKKVTCCQPSTPLNTPIAANISSQQCCTGKKYGNRCCLEDFTDVTLYLNRYVSSEANTLSETLFEPSTGYLKNPGDALTVANLKNICCSCRVAYGVAISELFVPGAEVNSNARTRRFLYSDGNTDNNNITGNIADKFNAKLKWNNHLYCVPADFEGGIDICQGQDASGGSGGSL